jgi:hypothetical protein
MVAEWAATRELEAEPEELREVSCWTWKKALQSKWSPPQLAAGGFALGRPTPVSVLVILDES